MNAVKKMVAASAFLVAFPTVSPAADMDLNPWTECGIGAMIFSNTPWAAAISNVIWDLGTTAVTSAYGSKNTCEGKKVAAAYFINQTYANLEEETVKGGGQHVTAVLNIMGCQSSAHEGIVNSMRDELSNTMQKPAYESQSTQEKAQGYYNILRNQTAAQCQVI